MSLTYLLVQHLTVFAVALLVTGTWRRYAWQRRWLDVPNARSSHSAPTPRGGGLAIACGATIGLGWLWLAGMASGALVAAVGLGGLLVAAVSLLDDRRHIRPRWRLLVHFLAAAWAVAWLGGLPPLPVLGIELPLGWFGALAAVLFTVWLLNLYNFMDGIDGIAGLEALTVAIGAALLLALFGEAAAAVPLLIVAVAVGGFLLWNWPPAKVFMGDVGSAYLGYVFAAFVLATAHQQLTLWSWLILLGVFLVDATWTLLRRLLSGQCVYQAHRQHAYQYAARYFGAHRPVTVAVGLINIGWLLPLAALATLRPDWGLLLLLIAWAPLIALCWWFRAGRPEGASPTPA